MINTERFVEPELIIRLCKPNDSLHFEYICILGCASLKLIKSHSYAMVCERGLFVRAGIYFLCKLIFIRKRFASIE